MVASLIDVPHFAPNRFRGAKSSGAMASPHSISLSILCLSGKIRGLPINLASQSVKSASRPIAIHQSRGALCLISLMAGGVLPCEMAPPAEQR